MLVSAVVVLAVVVVLNLVLTLALIGRLRTLTAAASAPRASHLDGPAIGSPVPRIEIAAVGGTVVDTAEASAEELLVAFVAAGCTPCHEQLPALRSLVASRAGQGGRAVVVVLAPDGDAEEFVTAFDGVAPVAVEGDEATIARAFEVTGYPAYIECSGGTVRSVHPTVADLRDLARL